MTFFFIFIEAITITFLIVSKNVASTTHGCQPCTLSVMVTMFDDCCLLHSHDATAADGGGYRVMGKVFEANQATQTSKATTVFIWSTELRWAIIGDILHPSCNGVELLTSALCDLCAVLTSHSISCLPLLEMSPQGYSCWHEHVYDNTQLHTL